MKRRDIIGYNLHPWTPNGGGSQPVFELELKDVFDRLYEKIKHGDKEHQDWLKNAMDEFLEEELNLTK